MVSSAHRIEHEPWYDRLSLPAYRYAEAARYAGLSVQTVASWARWYRVPEDRTADSTTSGPRLLSYPQLAEVAVAAAFRHAGVKVEDLHRVHGDLRVVLESDYPFTLLAFKTRGPVLLPHLQSGRFLSHAIGMQDGQRVWRQSIQDLFDQFDYEQGMALRWYPRGRDGIIVIDPRVAFGAPAIAGTGVATHILRQRYVGGESVEDIAEDFGVTQGQIEAALDFEGISVPAT